MRSHVDASSSAARVALEQMLELALAHGAEVHDRLTIRESAGDMSVHAEGPDGEVLVCLPEDLLIPVDGIEWAVSGTELSIVEHDPEATDVHRALAQAHVDLYNATGKIEWAKSALPSIALQSEDVAVEAIRVLRPGFARARRSAAEAFISTRVFVPSRARPERNGRRFLMPIVDLINHHERSERFELTDERMTVCISRTGGDSECFVRYGPRYDPLDLVLAHGFVDKSARFVRSIPLTVDLSWGATATVAGKRLATVSALDPPQVTMDAGRIELSHVTFARDRPDVMLAVLRLAVAAYLKRHGVVDVQPGEATVELLMAIANKNLEARIAAVGLLDIVDTPVASAVALALRAEQVVIDAVTAALEGC